MHAAEVFAIVQKGRYQRVGDHPRDDGHQDRGRLYRDGREEQQPVVDIRPRHVDDSHHEQRGKERNAGEWHGRREKNSRPRVGGAMYGRASAVAILLTGRTLSQQARVMRPVGAVKARTPTDRLFRHRRKVRREVGLGVLEDLHHRPSIRQRQRTVARLTGFPAEYLPQPPVDRRFRQGRQGGERW